MQFAQAFDRRIATYVFIFRERDDVALPVLQFQRNNFIIESARLNRRGGSLLRSQRVFILLITRNLVSLRKFFRRFSHHHSRKWIVKAVTIHSIHQIDVSHARTPTRAFSKVGNTRHAFSSTSEYDIRATQHYFVGRENDRPQSRAARLINRECRHAIRNLGAIGNLSRDVRPAACLPGASPD